MRKMSPAFFREPVSPPDLLRMGSEGPRAQERSPAGLRSRLPSSSFRQGTFGGCQAWRLASPALQSSLRLSFPNISSSRLLLQSRALDLEAGTGRGTSAGIFTWHESPRLGRKTTCSPFLSGRKTLTTQLPAQPWTDKKISVLPTSANTGSRIFPPSQTVCSNLNHADKGHLPRKGEQEVPGFTMKINHCFGSLPYCPSD
ncbi:uncharacterized protein LOC101177031 [Nomascus leucogenys]|uniref:uncharacterized protein LOC101177031 n=1 Tax=Nomascus leucogenys TaxID=61853 RepID=UPI00122D74B1|nr:uncharacterized protein LOC101177031 [Nomascus leucogenys]